MRRLCFGGSFNPIHHGHLLCARAVAEVAGFDQVVLLPSASPPHKPDARNLAPPHHRLEMCRLAAAEHAELFTVDDLELQLPPPSYTIQTVREMKRRNPEDQVFWLIGGDMLRYLPQWHEPLALMQEVTFVLMARPGWSFDWHTMPAEYRHLEKQVVAAPLIQISSTEIRLRVAAGQAIAYLTPPAVQTYIEKHGLYCGLEPEP
jgi:nicotinate-nucleotide adenylyltransferase